MRHFDLVIGLVVKKKHYIILAALLTIVFGVTYGRAAMFTHELVITVEKIDAPEVCHDGTSVLHRRYRSSTLSRTTWAIVDLFRLPMDSTNYPPPQNFCRHMT